MTSILFITPSLRAGGAERNIINIIRSLDRSLYHITIIICGGEKNYIQLLPSDISIINLNKTSVRKTYLDIYKIVKSKKPKIVFTSAVHLSTPVSIIKRITQNSFIDIVRVPSLPSNKLGKSVKSKIISAFTKTTYRRANKIVAQTDQMREEIIDYYHINPEKVISIPNIVDIKLIKSESNKGSSGLNKEKFNIVAIGTLYSVKGFDLLIKSLKATLIKIPNAHLTIIGEEGIEKGYRMVLENIIEDLHLQGFVTLAGFIKNPFPILKDADLFVLSSRKEGFPNVVLESLAVGTPVVATNCVSFDNVIKEGFNGYVVEKNNIEALAQGIIEGEKLEKTVFMYENYDFNKWFNKILNDESTTNNQ